MGCIPGLFVGSSIKTPAGVVLLFVVYNMKGHPDHRKKWSSQMVLTGHERLTDLYNRRVQKRVSDLNLVKASCQGLS